MDPFRSIWSTFLSLACLLFCVEGIQRGRCLGSLVADRPRASLAASARLCSSRRQAGQYSDLQAERSGGLAY